MAIPTHISLDKFTSFGELLKYLRRRAGLSQRDLSIAVGYSEGQVSRLEQNKRLPDLATITARFVEALDVKGEPAIVARLLELAVAIRREEAAPQTSHNLPLQLTSFIGREKEITAVRHLLAVNRLVTLTGPGGVGKTRLALQVADGVTDDFLNGVCWVELASIMDPALVPQADASRSLAPQITPVDIGQLRACGCSLFPVGRGIAAHLPWTNDHDN
jgi:transcriptional regulator with XRE-family HTH domain